MEKTIVFRISYGEYLEPVGYRLLDGTTFAEILTSDVNIEGQAFNEQCHVVIKLRLL